MRCPEDAEPPHRADRRVVEDAMPGAGGDARVEDASIRAEIDDEQHLTAEPALRGLFRIEQVVLREAVVDGLEIALR